MEQKIGYKVLTKDRWSSVMKSEHGGRKYDINKEVKPISDCGPLCVFDTYNNAGRFREMFCLGRALTVKCKYIQSKQIYISFIYLGNEERRILTKLPKGTILADSVTCLE
jgi:hypothetical protein